MQNEKVICVWDLDVLAALSDFLDEMISCLRRFALFFVLLAFVICSLWGPNSLDYLYPLAFALAVWIRTFFFFRENCPWGIALLLYFRTKWLRWHHLWNSVCEFASIVRNWVPDKDTQHWIKCRQAALEEIFQQNAPYPISSSVQIFVFLASIHFRMNNLVQGGL